MRQASLGMASLLVVAGLLAGCTAGTKDNGLEAASATPPTQQVAQCAESMAAMFSCTGGAVSPIQFDLPPAKLSTLLAVSGGAWVAPGTKLDVSVLPPAGATGAINYVWGYGPMGGTVPITQLSRSKTPLIEPGTSSSITFDQAGVFYEHCHPHPWMRSNVTVMDSGEAPITTTVHFVDGALPSQFKFSPENIVVPKGSTVIYQNDGAQAHQTMLMQQDAPLKPAAVTGSSGQVTATGTGWMRVVVYVMDSAGHFGSAEHDVYVAALPEPLTKKFTGAFNATVPSALPVPPPGPLQEPPQAFAFTATGAGHLFLNFTSQDGVSTNSPAGNPAGDQSAIKIDIASKDGSEKVGSSKSTNKGALDAALKGGDYTLKVTPMDGEGDTYTATITVIYDLVPPAANPYSDPSSQVVMGKL